MRPPSRRQACGCARRKAGVIEDELRLSSSFVELESHDRIEPWRPIFFTPRLNDALIGNQFDVAAQNHTPKNRERSAHFRTDLGGSALHDEIGHLAELFFLGERFVDAFPRRLEDNFLMNAFARMRDAIPIRLRVRSSECALRHSEQRQHCRQPHGKISSRRLRQAHFYCVVRHIVESLRILPRQGNSGLVSSSPEVFLQEHCGKAQNDGL